MLFRQESTLNSRLHTHFWAFHLKRKLCFSPCACTGIKRRFKHASTMNLFLPTPVFLFEVSSRLVSSGKCYRLVCSSGNKSSSKRNGTSRDTIRNPAPGRRSIEIVPSLQASPSTQCFAFFAGGGGLTRSSEGRVFMRVSNAVLSAKALPDGQIMVVICSSAYRSICPLHFLSLFQPKPQGLYLMLFDGFHDSLLRLPIVL